MCILPEQLYNIFFNLWNQLLLTNVSFYLRILSITIECIHVNTKNYCQAQPKQASQSLIELGWYSLIIRAVGNLHICGCRPSQPFWIKRAVRCCRRCSIAGGERVPPSPLGWYFFLLQQPYNWTVGRWARFWFMGLILKQ